MLTLLPLSYPLPPLSLPPLLSFSDKKMKTKKKNKKKKQNQQNKETGDLVNVDFLIVFC